MRPLRPYQRPKQYWSSHPFVVYSKYVWYPNIHIEIDNDGRGWEQYLTTSDIILASQLFTVRYYAATFQ